MKKQYINYLLGTILAFALLIRIVAIGQIPFGFVNDEVNYLFSAYNLWHTGQDMHGHVLPMSFQVDSSLSPVPIYIAAPFVGLLGPSPATGRLPYALMAVGSVFLVYKLIKQLFEKDSNALVSAFVFSINPWYLLITRSAWDGVVAQFFFLCGLVTFTKQIYKGNILWSLPFFLLGFYSYHATKVFFVALLIILFIFYQDILVKKKRQAILFSLGCIGIFLSFFVVSALYHVTRQEVLIFQEPSYVAKAVETVTYERNFSTATPKIKEIFSNKGWFFFYTMLDQYLGAFSPQYLFTVGDVSKTAGWGAFMKGAFYLIEAPLIILGIVGLALQKRKREAFLLLALLCIAPLPAAFGMSKTYLIRGVMMIPFMAALIGMGIVFSVRSSFDKKPVYGVLVLGMILLGYSIFVSRFVYQYAFQFTTYGSEYWNGSSRKIAEYIGKNKNKYTQTIVSREPDMFILHYGFENALDPRKVTYAWNARWPAKVDSVDLIDSCLNHGEGNPRDFLAPHTLYVSPGDCFATSSAMMEIRDPQDPQTVLWKVYEKN